MSCPGLRLRWSCTAESPSIHLTPATKNFTWTPHLPPHFYYELQLPTLPHNGLHPLPKWLLLKWGKRQRWGNHFQHHLQILLHWSSGLRNTCDNPFVTKYKGLSKEPFCCSSPLFCHSFPISPAFSPNLHLFILSPPADGLKGL